jgi:excisionase family DNA binding protein
VPEKLLTAAEVCDLLGITKRTISRLVAQGDLRAMRITASPFGELRFTEGDIKAYIRRHRVKPDGRQAAS